MISTNEGYTRLEYFSEDVAADKNRKEFDIKNHTLCYTNHRPDFLFIGDSITEYWELNAYFRNSDQLIINRGIAGDTTKYLKKRFYVDAVQLKPKYCILGIGINDSIELEGDYWKKLEPVPYSEKLKIVKSNIIEIIQQAKKEKIMLILTSLLPINIPILRYERDRKMYIKELNEWLMEMAKMNNLIFVNYYATMTFPGTDKLLDGITYDGLHPNAKGYQIMATVLKNTLKKMELESERRRNMIFDSISNKENYKEEKEIYQTLNFLEKLKKWDDVESNAIIQKDWISANPVSFLSKDESECMYEAHRKHIDVHYIMEGIEKIATADVKNLQEKVPFDKDKDIGFYEGCESGSYLLKTGDFMVCFPSDAHKVGMMNTVPGMVKKVVVKIRVEE